MKKILNDLAENPAYMIPVLIFFGVSLLHIFPVLGTDMRVMVYIAQGVSIAWASVFAFRRKLVLWPFIVIGLLFVIAGTSMYLLEERDLKKAAEAYASNDVLKSREILESINSREIQQSKEYLQLKDAVQQRSEQDMKILVKQARSEVKRNRIEEARSIVGRILGYDRDNEEAADLVETIKGKDLITSEKQLPPEMARKLKSLKRTVNAHIKRKKFDRARKIFDKFLSENGEVKRDSLIALSINDKIETSEKNALYAREKRQNRRRLKEALGLFKEGRYEKSEELAELILQYDPKNRAAKKLLVKARTNIRKEREESLLQYKAAGSFLLFVVLMILLVRFITRCPSCGKHGARKVVDEYETDRRESYRWGTTWDSITMYGSGGAQHGTVSRSVQIPTWIITMRTDYSCRYCSYEWYVETDVQVDQ